MKQGNCHVVEYVLDFHTLAVESGWNEIVLKSVFHLGLDGASLDSIIDLAI